jgi:hypothetical protein
MTAPCRVVPQQVKHVSLPPGEAGGGAIALACHTSSMPGPLHYMPCVPVASHARPCVRAPVCGHQGCSSQ